MRGIILSVAIALLIIVGQPVGASIQLPPPGNTVVACDFVTGGGFIVGSGSPESSLAAGAKANFAVGGGVKNGAFWGHLEYNDHSTSPPMRVHGTGVTGYFLGTDTSKPNDRVITGTAEINGVGGFTYMVEVNDNAEPGRGVDEFSIDLSNGYEAGFDSPYNDGPIAGGNIQLHPGNRSSTPPSGFTCAAS